MAVAPDLAASVAAAHFAEPKNVLARNVIANDLIKPGFADQPIADLLIDRDARIGAEHIYSDVLATEGKPSSQKASGRCWMFAALNVMRLPMMRRYSLDSSFELSHSYLFFYDKLERFNYVLEQVLDTTSEPVDSRLLMHLLHAPLMDGGQWDMLSSLVAKYGVVPKTAYPETLTSGASRSMCVPASAVWLARQD